MTDSRTLRIESTRGDGAWAELAPARGAIVTRFFTSGRHVLSLDESTLLDPTKNVRGGIPILFPAPGKLEEGRFVFEGAAFEMKQHGFARDRAWSVVAHTGDHVTLGLDSTADTRVQFPFDFALTFTFTLEGGALRILQRFENRSAAAMPLHAGFHPYFLVPDAEKARTTIATRATKAFDNVTKRDIPFDGFDLTLPEVDLHLADHGGSTCVLTRPDGKGSVTIEASSEFTHWVVWTVAGKDYVCVEPWTAPGNALNSG
ncbi:MAG: galactose mutarotase, partial [Thermoanaerobaculia bacterium]